MEIFCIIKTKIGFFMKMLTLSANHFLDLYVLNAEFSKKAKISANAYRYWKNIYAASFESSRSVFLKKDTIPKKHEKIISSCHDLSGLVLSSAFCSFTGLSSSHLTKSNGSKLYEKLEITIIEGIKFVNLKKFYDDLGLSYDYNLYIEKCCYFSPEPLEKKIKLTSTMCVGYY